MGARYRLASGRHNTRIRGGRDKDMNQRAKNRLEDIVGDLESFQNSGHRFTQADEDGLMKAKNALMALIF